MTSSIQFTRYLYLKDEVKLSILISLLKKNDEALFWAYEFYYSGFKDELWDFIWTIYYDFYASLNPNFKTFIAENCESREDAGIENVITNLRIRPWNADVFLLKQQAKQAKTPTLTKLDDLLINKNYEEIARYIFTNDIDIDTLVRHFSPTSKKICKTWSIKMNKNQLLAEIMHLYSVQASIKMGKNLYLTNESNISQFKTIFANYDTSFYPYKILPLVTKYGIDSEHTLSLFRLSRDDSCENLRDIYKYNWMYYTFQTPVWSNRVEEFEGIFNHETKTIDFDNDDDFDEFYDHFNYEPDEQKLEIQEKNIGKINTGKTWKSEFEKKTGLFKPDDAFWNKLEKIIY
jgi:hypothetical protein